MADKLRFPVLFSQRGQDGNYLRWIRATGDVVRLDQPLAEIDLDKCAVEVWAPVGGVLHRCHEEGELEPGQIVAEIEPDGTLTEAEVLARGEATLLGAVLDHAHHDAPRRQYARWLLEIAARSLAIGARRPFELKARGEFILASLGGDAEPWGYEEQLVTQRALLAREGIPGEATFVRGFVDGLRVDAAELVARAGHVRSRIPLRRLWLTGVEPALLGGLFPARHGYEPPLPDLEELRLEGRLDQGRWPESLGPRTLRSLVIRDAGLTDEGWSRVSVWSMWLRTLDLSGNQLGDAAVQAMAGAELGGWRSWQVPLERLDLSGNHIGDAGAIALAGLRLDKLRVLNLAGNTIGDAGAAALAAAGLPALEELDLLGNPVTDRGIAALFGGAPGQARIRVR